MSWPIGLSTGIAYRHPIEQVLPVVAAAGSSHIEVSTAPSHIDIADVRRLRGLRRVTDALGLRVHSLHGPFGHDVNLTQQLPAEATGVCVDTPHCSLGGFLFEALESHRSRLVHLQGSDNRGHTDDHLPPGDGVIDWPRVLLSLERAGYTGVFMLEVAGNGDVAGHVDRLAGLTVPRLRSPVGRES
jgi:sugar phosphate isomerase/epimerase